ncbi:MAG: putative Zn-dependent protease [Planctomycetota bacterium]|jgi:predicted Zn-dependent protease
MNKLKQIIPLLSVCLLLFACAKNPVTGDRDFVTVSEQEEIAQGQRYHQSIIAQYGVYKDVALQSYINRIGQELARQSHRSHLNYTFTLLDSPEINAFALPGGYVYITRGIMAYLNSEAELAGVLGHEIGHVTARHSVRQQSGQFASSIFSVLVSAATGSGSLGNLSQQISTGIVRGYGREHELEADKLGAVYLHKSGYDPDNMLGVIGVLKDQEVYEKALAAKQNRPANIYHGVFSTHPKNDQRLRTVVAAAKKLSDKQYRPDNQLAYYQYINDMSWGQSARQGILNGNRFTHPELAISISLPANWAHTNTQEYLTSQQATSGARLQINVEARQEGESLPDLLKRLTNNTKLTAIMERYGATSLTRVKLANGESQPAQLTAININDNQALILLGTTSAENFELLSPQFIATSKSFRRLSPSDINAIKYQRLRVIERDPKMSFESLAQSSSLNEPAIDTLRLLNRSFPEGKINQLSHIKTVTYDD